MGQRQLPGDGTLSRAWIPIAIATRRAGVILSGIPSFSPRWLRYDVSHFSPPSLLRTHRTGELFVGAWAVARVRRGLDDRRSGITHGGEWRIESAMGPVRFRRPDADGHLGDRTRGHSGWERDYRPELPSIGHLATRESMAGAAADLGAIPNRVEHVRQSAGQPKSDLRSKYRGRSRGGL